ncbi:hypothetical protein [Cytobacillus sp. BC1816]|uniref:hypothetical protein n=1 Tax=Cytobacillus sp. BC1816 TaxID=3440154 RepID=UPI003F515943
MKVILKNSTRLGPFHFQQAVCLTCPNIVPNVNSAIEILWIPLAFVIKMPSLFCFERHFNYSAVRSSLYVINTSAHKDSPAASNPSKKTENPLEDNPVLPLPAALLGKQKWKKQFS